MLDVTDIHADYVPFLVEHIASGRFGNLKRLHLQIYWADRNRNHVIPSIEWNIRPLDSLVLFDVPRHKLEIFGCLHAMEVNVVGGSEQAVIGLVRGGCFQGDGSTEVLATAFAIHTVGGACANRISELLVKC